MAEAEFRYSDLLPTGADGTPYRLDLVAQGAQDPAVRLRAPVSLVLSATQAPNRVTGLSSS